MKLRKTGPVSLNRPGDYRLAGLLLVISFFSLALCSCGETNPAPVITATISSATTEAITIPATGLLNPSPTPAFTPSATPSAAIPTAIPSPTSLTSTSPATPSSTATPVTTAPTVMPATPVISANLLLQTIWRTDTNQDRLRGLTGLATDSQGNVYLSDYWQGIVRKYDAQGKQLFELKAKEIPDTFDSPGALATDNKDNLYVLGTGQQRVYKYDSSGKLLFNFPSYPINSPGPFSGPAGLAIDDTGLIYVLDGVGRVYRFDAAGKYLSTWGNPVGQDNPDQNTAPGRLKYPVGLATDGKNYIYVGDFGNHRIQKFTLAGKYITGWENTGSGSGPLGDYSGANGLAVDRLGNIFVADSANQRVQKFTAAGQYLATIGQGYGREDGQFNTPLAVAVDRQGLVYANDAGNERIQKFDPAGKVVGKIGRQNKGEGELSAPYSLAVDGTGNVFISEEVTRIIQKFDGNGRFLRMWPVESQVKITRNSPTGLSLSADAAGNLYVADPLDNLIKKYDSNGQLILSWGGTGAQGGQFNGPSHSFIDRQGNIYLIDGSNHRIQAFDSQGHFLTKYDFGLEPPSSSGEKIQQVPAAVAVDPGGNLYVAFFSCSCIRKYDSKGALLLEWGRPPEGTNGNDGQIFVPVNLVLDDQGNVYVLDHANSHCSGCRIQKFTPYGQLLAVWGSLFSPSPMYPAPVPGNGQFGYITSMAVDRQGNIYVAEPGYGRLQKLRQTS